MAGSIKTFEYTTDGGDVFAIEMDESNGEALSNQDYTDVSTAVYYLPRNIKMRKARYRSSDGLTARNIPVTSNTATSTTLPSTIDVADGNGGTISLTLTGFNGESTRILPKAADTGITDGDAT